MGGSTVSELEIKLRSGTSMNQKAGVHGLDEFHTPTSASAAHCLLENSSLPSERMIFEPVRDSRFSSIPMLDLRVTKLSQPSSTREPQTVHGVGC